MTTVDPSEKKYELDPLVTRVLKRGDLTRINSEKPGKLCDHHGDLARVVQAIPVGPTLENSHPYVYDLELVLGGKLHGIFRADLLYTTASQEGMTDDSRARRKRKPNIPVDTEAEIDESKKPRGKGGRKKQGPAKKGKTGPVTTTTAKPNMSKKRPVGDMKSKVTSSKKPKPNLSDDNVASSNTAASHAMDLFERHRREFERSLGRLEKSDAYNFFGTAVPPEFEEVYINPRVTSMEGTDSAVSMSDGRSTSEILLAQHYDITSQSQSPSTEFRSNEKSAKKKKRHEDGDHNDDERIQFPSTPPFNFVVIRQRMELGRYILDRVRLENEERIKLLTPYWKSIGKKNVNRRQKKSRIPVLHPKGINWDLFRKDIHDMCDAAVERNKHLVDIGPGTLGHAASKIKDLMEQIYEKNGRRHFIEMSAANDRHRFSLAMDQTTNTEAAVQGKWKRDAFPERKYERLKGDVVCAGLSQLDEKIAAYELKTTLEDKFIGLAYKYDDTGQSEGWMKSVLELAGEQSKRQQAALALASDDGAIKAQVAASMQSLLIGVLDKVMTETGVLEQKELRCANSEIEENPPSHEVVPFDDRSARRGPEFVVHEVWGIDCYTRRNVAICLGTEFDSDTVQAFTEKWLLPAINSCPPDLAYDISNACRVLEGLPFDASTSLENENGTTYDEWKESLLGTALLKKITTSGPPWLSAVAHLLQRARENLGPDFFRIHPKGHGSIVLCERLEPNRLVTFYRGETYPSWRWGEKIDAIAKIQQQKGLKPVLPDFFNMALERPQHDPRGYGLLFVDASRKSNYGSMLSHSCQPSCEVHVVAVKGELRLAITTIREMTIGDELTFDYNAVTESLFEYQSAVCLCGHWRCSGSFLHFATADCYQQVLNRNSPVASRLANLIKGCTKKVMSDEDDKILKRHGFQTAAFGAVSVNRRNASALDNLDSTLDSMDIVPVWLRTYVADTLRYIEYERRALPIALICNDLYDESGSAAPASNATDDDDDNSSEEEDCDQISVEADKPVKRSKPEPTFFYYARNQRDYFISLLDDDEDKKSLTGAELKREVQKLASAHWKSLDEDAKASWKVKAFEEWERNGGDRTDIDDTKKGRHRKHDKLNTNESNTCSLKSKPKISFQEADAEGVSAMEQRIQQLAQTLSRVGRVLDRHRESTLRLKNGSDQPISDEALREVTHSPLVIMPDEHVVAWVWNHSDGLVRTLLKYIQNDVCISPELKQSIIETVTKHAVLEKFGSPWIDPHVESTYPMEPGEGRERLNEALLELRKNLLDGIQHMASVIKKRKAKSRSTARNKEREEKETRFQESDDDNGIYSVVKSLMDEMLGTVEKRFSDPPPLKEDDDMVFTVVDTSGHELMPLTAVDNIEVDLDLEPWLRNFNKRFKIEKAADLLLLYARTGHFFSMQAYHPLKSSPIEVYARDLGNAVPASTIDHELIKEPESAVSSPGLCTSRDGDNDSIESKSTEENAIQTNRRSKKLCNPEDIISNVVIEYQGDYVLSQLLQWYNAGIGQKPGLPDLLGCVLLPSMKGCWTIDGTTVSNSHTDRATRYQSTTRRSLIEWFKDPLKRGNPWPDDVRKAFVEKEDSMIPNASNTWLPFGSPILDFLVTGDDSNLNTVMATLSSFHSSSTRSGNVVGDGLLSSVDEGRPAEAVSNWVQCENPGCHKWRKVPWYIDIDMLPEQFFCKDIVWNPKAATCDSPEDEWDQSADAQVVADANVSILSSSLNASKIKPRDSIHSFKLCDFRLGAQFDIRRSGKENWVVGTVIKLDLTGDIKRVKVHYPKMQMKYDEWLDIDSPRIAPLYSKVQRPLKKESIDITLQSKGSKSDKLLVSKEKKRVIKSSIKQKNVINQDTAFTDDSEPNVKVLNTHDSSLIDTFFDDSEDDDDPAISMSVSRPATSRRPASQDFDDDTDPDEGEQEFDALIDTDDEEVGIRQVETARSKRKNDPGKGDDASTVDEEVGIRQVETARSKRKNDPGKGDDASTVGETSEDPNVSNGKSTSWTIPKKKNPPVTNSLLSPEGDNPLSSSPRDLANANRIPRKKLSTTGTETKSLLLTEPKQNTTTLSQDERQHRLPSQTRTPLADSQPVEGSRLPLKPATSFPVETSRTFNSSQHSRSITTFRKDFSNATGNVESNGPTVDSCSSHRRQERAMPGDDYSRNRVPSDVPPNTNQHRHSSKHLRDKHRDQWDVRKPESLRSGYRGSSRSDEIPYRDRYYSGESPSDGKSRDYSRYPENEHPRRLYDDRRSSRQSEISRHEEVYSPAIDDAKRGYYHDSRGSYSSRPTNSYRGDRHRSEKPSYDEDRWHSRRYETSKDYGGEDSHRPWGRTSRDRGEGGASRRYEQSFEAKSYDTYRGRHSTRYDEYDEYRYHSHDYDRTQGHEKVRYEESVKRKPRPDRSRDRSRDDAKGHHDVHSDHARQDIKETSRQEIQYNSANFDEQEFLGGHRASKGRALGTDKGMTRKEDATHPKKYTERSWRQTDLAR